MQKLRDQGSICSRDKKNCDFFSPAYSLALVDRVIRYLCWWWEVAETRWNSRVERMLAQTPPSYFMICIFWPDEPNTYITRTLFIGKENKTHVTWTRLYNWYWCVLVVGWRNRKAPRHILLFKMGTSRNVKIHGRKMFRAYEIRNWRSI